MASEAPATGAPTYRTGWLWGVLTLFLVAGVVGSGFVVYGVSQAFLSGAWALDLALALAGGVVATFSLLMVAGMLYRVDRLRGEPHRVVRLFE